MPRPGCQNPSHPGVKSLQTGVFGTFSACLDQNRSPIQQKKLHISQKTDISDVCGQKAQGDSSVIDKMACYHFSKLSDSVTVVFPFLFVR